MGLEYLATWMVDFLWSMQVKYTIHGSYGYLSLSANVGTKTLQIGGFLGFFRNTWGSDDRMVTFWSIPLQLTHSKVTDLKLYSECFPAVYIFRPDCRGQSLLQTFFTPSLSDELGFSMKPDMKTFQNHGEKYDIVHINWCILTRFRFKPSTVIWYPPASSSWPAVECYLFLLVKVTVCQTKP